MRVKPIGMNPKTISPSALLAFLVCCLTLIPPVMGRGGFIDGLLYASVCRNLSQEVWFATHLSFSDTFHSVFAEHPPLMFWMGSWWFRLMGDHAWTEKSFSLLIAAGTWTAFYYFWKRNVLGQMNQYGWGWWVLLWCLVPGPLWGLGQLMLENPLTLFSFLAVWSAMGSNSLRAGVGLGFLTGLAFITKGPPALFPMAAPCLLAVARLRPNSQMLRVTAWSSVVLVVFTWIGWSWKPLRVAMQGYWQKQVHAVFSGERPSYEVGSERTRIDMALTFVEEMLVPLALLFLCYGVYRWLKQRGGLKSDGGTHDPQLKKYALFFLLVALSASLPLFVSPKLHPHYLIPSYPWWTLTLTCAALPVLRQLPFYTWSLSQQRPFIMLNAAVIVCVLGCLGYAWTYREVPVRDFALQSDIQYVVNTLKNAEAKGDCRGIAIAPELHGHYAIWLYMQRYYRLSLFPSPNSQHCLVLKGKGSSGLEGFMRQSADLRHFDVYAVPSALHKY
jgi:4-amino-4-deoxy-L-arabinose transferase-like glycosyltransferase